MSAFTAWSEPVEVVLSGNEGGRKAFQFRMPGPYVVHQAADIGLQFRHFGLAPAPLIRAIRRWARPHDQLIDLITLSSSDYGFVLATLLRELSGADVRQFMMEKQAFRDLFKPAELSITVLGPRQSDSSLFGPGTVLVYSRLESSSSTVLGDAA